MMTGGLGEDARAVLDAAALGIGRAVIEAADAGEGNGLRAHGAGLQRDIKIAARQPFRPERVGGLADHQHFGMGRGVGRLARAVARHRDHPPSCALDQHGAHRHLTARGGQ